MNNDPPSNNVPPSNCRPTFINLGNSCTDKEDIFKLLIKIFDSLRVWCWGYESILGVFLAKQPALDKQNTRKNPQNLHIFFKIYFLIEIEKSCKNNVPP